MNKTIQITTNLLAIITILLMVASVLWAALTLTGCASDAYQVQRVKISGHGLILHETRVDMENAYELWWAGIADQREKAKRGTYAGFFDPWKNDLHCVVPWPESCILHEYLHLAGSHGLEFPPAPQYDHFRRGGKR